jgi:AcrR family transcriptional regulator
MPRGRARGYELQRETILARAAELFARRGYTATTMNEVAEACGVSKPSLYHYVRDKHQLLAEIAEGHVVRLLALVAEVEAARLPPEPHLRRLIAAFLAVYARSQAEHRVLTEDVRFLNDLERDRTVGAERRVVAAFADAIAATRPELRAASFEKPLAMLLFGMMNWMFTWLQPEGELSHDDLAPVVADLFFGGIGAVHAPARRSRPSSLDNTGDTACPSPQKRSSPSASPRRPRSRLPTSTSA